MSSLTQLGTYAKFTPKQKATTLAMLHVPSAILANWPCHMASCRTWPWDALASGNDVNVPAQNLLHSRVRPHKTSYRNLI